MKLLIVLSCCLAAVYASGVGHAVYSLRYAHHFPVVDAAGHPLDEPVVAAAKAQHAVDYANIAAHNGGVAVVAHAAPVVAHRAYVGPVSHYAGPIHLPVIGPNGVPVDEPAVQAARANHAAQHVEAKVRNGDVAVAVPTYGVAAVAHVAHVAHGAHGAHGVPADTPEVAAAKAAHFAAHVDAKVRNGVVHPLLHYRRRRSAVGYVAPIAHYSGPIHVPVIGPNGVPVDEPVVAAAKVAHAAAHVEAKVRNGDVAVVAPYSVTAPYAYAAPVAHYIGAQHLPVIGPNGVPLDEPAVAAARAHHAAAHVEAKVRNGDVATVVAAAPVAYTGHYGYVGGHHVPVIGPGGVPVDEPAVAAAKVAHATAHVEAKARSGHVHVVGPVVHAY